jgi:hypothetical protein
MGQSRVDAGKTPLDEYVSVVASIYSTHDRNRSIWDVWCHALHHAAGVSEQIRKGAADEDLYREIADFSLWLFTMVLKLSGKFGRSDGSPEAPSDKFIRIQSTCSNLLWLKYPKCCPACSASRIVESRTEDVGLGQINPCECQLRPPEAEDAVARSKRIEVLQNYSTMISNERPTGIDEWQTMFGNVFESRLEALALSQIALHLMEELGEVSDAMIRMYTYSEEKFVKGEPNRRQLKLESEIADVFSWLFGLVEKLDSMRHSTVKGEGVGPKPPAPPANPVRLSAIIWERYGSHVLNSFCCWKCGALPCRCHIILVPTTRDAEELMKRFQ